MDDMSNEDVLSLAAARAARAKALIESDLVQEAFASLEQAYTTAWRSTTIEDVSAREKLFLAINIVGKVRDHLNSVVSNGTLAAAELKALADTAERKKHWNEVR